MKHLTKPLVAAVATSALSFNALSAEIKNVILMIGDGMGPQQVGLLETYANKAPNSIYQGQPTALFKLAQEGVIGSSLTHPEDAIVVDSACSATMLSTGIYTGSEVIGIDSQGNHVQTVLEKAKSMGKATGLVSDTRLTHATPAAFAAHQPHRSLENDIASDMLDTGVDVMLSGGLRHWIPQSTNEKGETYNQLKTLTQGDVYLKSKRKDERNLLNEAQQDGYQLAFNREMMSKVQGNKLLGLFSYSGMNDGIAYSVSKDDPDRTQPSLKEMTDKALDILSKDEDGFFLMVEGGQIDWAGHSNDAGTMLHEMLKFDEAVNTVYQWAQGREDTIVIVTADHETGSFGFSYSSQDLPKPEARKGEAFAERSYAPNFNFGSFQILDNLYNQKKSYYGIVSEFQKLTKNQQTAAKFAELVNKNTEFPITSGQAANVLASKPNPYRLAGHKYLAAEEVPAINDFDAFFPYNDRGNLLAREQATSQNIVWGTGTHTHTPVNVFAWGPAEAIIPVSKIMHHSELGEYIKTQVK
ncbi:MULTISPECIES: alkaline phosphatase [Vibrio]|uniref:alkaline phosphatase n=1 Tax=Vibrio TaxID=662 RepID=UPI002074EE5B|nr:MULTISPECIES: alkaline phosphatase [Vibrio]USD31634.1 alkaline phosphatase [Vibrio sp. SCSIO 43186]USD44677.1 alkaline phosphatase [Vibrio sp. SCSIO 43145]USD68757.1 alkaline phosphatase [Vibrio sp. SCSIO 43139]USD96447.1 alkaline phosphatase [Vibrio coralliilyticus]